jgi:L-galactose dehydrogenase
VFERRKGSRNCVESPCARRPTPDVIKQQELSTGTCDGAKTEQFSRRVTTMLLRRACGALVRPLIPGFHHESASLMPMNNFGSTLHPEQWVSAFSYGAAALGSVFGDIDEAEAEECVIEAVKSGVNLIDVAPWYGFEAKAEKVLGRALKWIPREAYYLQTKVGRYNTAEGISKRFDFSYERTLKSVDESLERLGVDYVDTIQIHDPEFAPSLDIILEETIPALQEVVRRGKAKAIGITGYPLEMLVELASRVPKGTLTSAITYCHYNLHSTKLVDSGALAKLQKEHGLGVINASPLSMGLLTPAGPPSWHPAGDELKKRRTEANAWLEERGCNISRLGMAFCLDASTSSPAIIPTTMGSTASLKELRESLDLVTGVKPLTAHERECMVKVRELFFSGTGFERSWEGVEVVKYWRKLQEE